MATATKALRKENEALKEEIQQIMTKLQHLEQKFDTKKEADGMAAHKGEAISSDKAKSIEFISNQYMMNWLDLKLMPWKNWNP